jgi:hypothetical protein
MASGRGGQPAGRPRLGVLKLSPLSAIIVFTAMFLPLDNLFSTVLLPFCKNPQSR